MEEPSLFGGKKKSADVVQGSLRDGYFLAACASIYERPDTFNKVFNIEDLSEGNGAIPVNMYAAGKKVTVMVDDYLPFIKEVTEKNGKKQGPYKFIFARPGADGSSWIPIMEKVWAKMSGTFNNIEDGTFNEAGTALTGAPGNTYKIVKVDKDDIWKNIEDRSQNYILSASVPQNGDLDKLNAIGLFNGHAYPILSTHKVVTDISTNATTRLIRFRNHWGNDTYSGPWNDQDTERWTDSAKSQLGDLYSNDVTDGVFFVDIDTFINNFDTYSILYYNENF